MTRLPNKAKSNVLESELKLLRKLKEIMEVMNSYTEDLIGFVFDSINRSIPLQIVMAGSNARLGGCDEKIFESYQNIIQYYKSTMKQYSVSKDILVSPKIVHILEGICDVISSRIRQFEEEQNDQNPILVEKKDILRHNANSFAQGMDVVTGCFYEAKLSHCQQGIRQLFLAAFDELDTMKESEALEYIFTEVLDECFDSIQELYADRVAQCLSELNDIESRKETSRYYELLKEEQELLSSIIIIQISALENEAGCSPTEKIELNKIIMNLQEGYQYLNKDVAEIIAYLKDMGGKDNAQSFENNKEDLTFEIKKYVALKNQNILFSRFSIMQNDLRDQVSQLQTIFWKQFEFVFKKEFHGQAYYRTIYESQKNVSAQVFLLDEMIAVFLTLVEIYEQTKDEFVRDTYFEIVNGIAETMAIKVESLKENKHSFTESCHKLLERFKSEKTELATEDAEAFKKQIFHQFLEQTIPTENLDDIGLNKLLRDVVLSVIGEEKLAQYHQKFDKQLTAYIESINKKIFSLKKECLLFEVSTFEEILTYSVTRLAESTDEKIVQFVNAVDSVTKNIEVLLKKNNIVLIRPQPHEMFNAKEHEVLMVEKLPDYQKGEIIKLMNSGYRQGETVIIRANIIAAK